MTMTYTEQFQALETVNAMQEKAKELQAETKAHYDALETMAKELNMITDPVKFNKAYAAYRTRLEEADISADTTRLAYAMAEVALAGVVGSANQTFH